MLWNDVLERCVGAQVRLAQSDGVVIQGAIVSASITDRSRTMEIICRWLFSKTPRSEWKQTGLRPIQFDTTRTIPREVGGDVIRIRIPDQGELEILPTSHPDTLSLVIMPSALCDTPS